MVSSGDRQRYAQRIGELEPAAVLDKPVAQADLAAALLSACLGEEMATEARAHNEIEHVPPVSARVLVVEDTSANWQLLERILRKRGHEVAVAENGREALDRCSQQKFDAILMDVQMPAMDGLQATAAIRALDGCSQRDATPPDVPIIAMTAHAMKRDEARCLAAGMDAYISKPVNAKQLLVTLEQLVASIQQDANAEGGDAKGESGVTDAGVKTPASGNATERPTMPANADEILHLDAALKRLGGDRELLSHMVRLFFEDSPGLLDRIDEMIDRNQPADVQRAAHSLKGLCANFDAQFATAAALAVEDAAKVEAMEQVRRGVVPLKEEVQRLKAALRPYAPDTKG